MIKRYQLTTVEEDFRQIGLLPALTEGDDPSKPREIASPDPSTLKGLDDSEGDKSAKSASAKQPKPKMGPADDDAEKSGFDPEEDGGSKGAQKGGSGSYHKVAGGKESLKGEAKELKGYQKAKKDVHPKGVKKNKAQSVKVAQGLKPVKKHAGMKAEGTLGKAANLIEEVEGLLRGIQIDEEVDHLLRGFRLVSEDAALLADRLTEISHLYDVDGAVAAMEELSKDAAEAVGLIETELDDVGDDAEEAEATKHSAEAAGETVEELDEPEEGKKKVKSDRNPEKEYDIPSPAFKEDSEKLFQAMVGKLMDALEAYDYTLDDMAGDEVNADAYEGEGDGGMEFDADNLESDEFEPAEDDMDAYEGEPESDDEPQDDEPQGDDDDQKGAEDQDGEPEGDEPQGEPEGDEPQDGEQGGEEPQQDLMAKMKALRAAREAQAAKGQAPFRGPQ